MRADRLLSLLMLLQARGKMSARELAAELEVSERTIYRDIEALSIAGFPVYGESGREGGYALLDRYRTNLTGLTDGEVRALFMLSIPGPLVELGVGQELKAALLKLSAALPDGQRSDEDRVRQRFHLDSAWWHQGQEPVPHLPTVHQAVWQDRKLHVVYRRPAGYEVEQDVDPYGLVAKAGAWYVVYARKGWTDALRVSSLVDARLLDQCFQRPADLDLAACWQALCIEQERARSLYAVTLRVAPGFLPYLPRYFGHRIHREIAQAEPPDAEGWTTLQLSFESFDAARERLLVCGGGVEVLEPQALRRGVLDFAEQIVARHSSG